MFFPLLLFPKDIFALDVSIDSATITNQRAGQKGFVWTSGSTGYFFYIDADGDFKYTKTTNGGQSWGGLTTIYTGDVVAYGIWFDKWTPGGTGTVIHTAYTETDTDDVRYRSLDTNGDSLGTETTVFAGNSATFSVAGFTSITKTRGGYLFVATDIDGGAEGGLFRSTDSGANWGSRGTGFIPLGSEQGTMRLYPGNESDNNDVYGLYNDFEFNTLLLKTHDDSANSNSSSATIMSLTESTTSNTEHYGYDASVRHSDNHLIIAGHSLYDSSLTDFRVFDLTNGSTWSELTAITADKDDNYHPSVYIDDETDDIYIAYNGNIAGTETLGTATGIYYVKSVNDGTSWGNETTISLSTNDNFQTWTAPNGPVFAVAWRDASSHQLLSSYDTTIDFSNTIVPVSRTNKRSSNGGTSVTSDAMDTTGATLIVLGISHYAPGGAITVSDSKSNTWTALTPHDLAGSQSRIYYSSSPTVGTGHTFTVSQVGSFPSIVATAWRGVVATSPFDVENGSSVFGTTLQPGSVSPSTDNQLLFTHLLTSGTAVPTINSNFKTSNFQVGAGGEAIGGTFGYLIQTTAASVNPTWTVSVSASLATNIATFKAEEVVVASTPRVIRLKNTRLKNVRLR